MLNGLERFLVEKIRVNTIYDLGFIKPTQAEIISSCLFLIGLTIVFWKLKNNSKE
jgi:prolipoprotein diacylglyceryltransferase